MGVMEAPSAARMLSGDRRHEYLAALADPDVKPNEAAQAVGLTGTKIRALRRRDHVFDQQCRDAERERKLNHAEDVVQEMRNRMAVSDRILEVEAATHGPLVDPDYRHLRRDRVKVDATVTGVVIQLPPDWQELPLDEKRRLRETIARMGGRVIEQGQSTTTEEE